MDVTEDLLQYAETPRQREAIQLCLAYGNRQDARKAMGIAASSFHNLLTRVFERARLGGKLPELGVDKGVFPPHIATGVSRYFKTEDGGYWLKTKLEHSAYLGAIRAAVDEMVQDVRPQKPVRVRPQFKQLGDLLNLHVLTDLHIGALSWPEETGDDWNTDIAEQKILAGIRYTLENSPHAHTGFFCQLGDALHYDGLEPITPTSGHVVDSDSRFHRVVRTAIRVFRQSINMMLQKYEQVIVLNAQGNHDLASSVWLQEGFAALYQDDKRCQVITSPKPHYGFLHGGVFLGFHHGHKLKRTDLRREFNGRHYRSMIGQARRIYLHCGHFHHSAKEPEGDCNFGSVEQHPTIAARSSHESNLGYDSDRFMSCITYDERRERSRVLWHPEDEE